MKIYKRAVLCVVAVAMCGSACFIRRNYANEQLISADTKIEIAETEISNLNVNTDKTETEVVLETVLETTAEVTEEILTETTFSASTENLKTIKHNSELSNFIASWENSNLFNYENNKEFESFEQINEYVMPNSKFYIITKDEDNCLNVGYGICLRSNGQWLNQSYFSEYEVDITKLTEGDVISADIVKRVHEDIISEIRNFVKKKMEKNGIELLGTQLDALTALYISLVCMELI